MYLFIKFIYLFIYLFILNKPPGLIKRSERATARLKAFVFK